MRQLTETMARVPILWLVCVSCLLPPAATQQLDYSNHSYSRGLDCGDPSNPDAPNCVDPCENYVRLDEPSRSMEHETEEPVCDKNLQGWYRFVGDGGVKLAETCVPMFRCETGAPMWLSGSHPTPEEGIVSRTACAHWSDNCCLWKKEVKVKACPGDYYVYLLQGTPDCDLRYCTDPSTAQGKCDETCRPEEECRLENGVWGCFCRKDLVSEAEALQHRLSCGNEEMKVFLDHCQLGGLGFGDEISIFLQDRMCSGTMQKEEDNWVSATIPTRAAACGNVLEKNETHTIYKNSLSLVNDFIIRDKILKVNFQCAYPTDMKVSLETALQPIVSTINIDTSGGGEFTVRMAVFQDPDFTLPYEGEKVILPVESMLYVGAMVEKGDTSHFKLLLRNCYATPSENRDDSVKYFIIQNSCPNQFDTTISVVENGESAESRFSVQMFSFSGNSDLVYLHCEVHLCDSQTEQCKPSCFRKQRRTETAVIDPARVLVLGPIARKGSSFDVTSGSPSTAGFLVAWTVLLLPVLLAALC